MKICNKCKKEHSLSSIWCKICMHKYRKQRKGKYQQTIDLINTLKSAACIDCKGKFPSWVMHYDHIEPNTKTDKVSSLLKRQAPLLEILQEIAKCELVCANCHYDRTYKRKQAEIAKFEKDNGIT